MNIFNVLELDDRVRSLEDVFSLMKFLAVQIRCV
jgi:hypothetical protein